MTRRRDHISIGIQMIYDTIKLLYENRQRKRRFHKESAQKWATNSTKTKVVYKQRGRRRYKILCSYIKKRYQRIAENYYNHFWCDQATKKHISKVRRWESGEEIFLIFNTKSDGDPYIGKNLWRKKIEARNHVLQERKNDLRPKLLRLYWMLVWKHSHRWANI